MCKKKIIFFKDFLALSIVGVLTLFVFFLYIKRPFKYKIKPSFPKSENPRLQKQWVFENIEKMVLAFKVDLQKKTGHSTIKYHIKGGSSYKCGKEKLQLIIKRIKATGQEEYD